MTNLQVGRLGRGTRLNYIKHFNKIIRYHTYIIMEIKVDLEQERVAKVKELKGICSHLPGGSEEFMREKHIY